MSLDDSLIRNMYEYVKNIDNKSIFIKRNKLAERRIRNKGFIEDSRKKHLKIMLEDTEYYFTIDINKLINYIINLKEI
jgi:hypothetical protein